jgi:hypothetical protein
VACRFHDPPNDDLVSWPVRPAEEESLNVKYFCLVYREVEKVGALPQCVTEAVATEDPDELEALQQSGHYVTSARLQPAETATTVRVRGGSVFIAGGPAVGTTEQLGGFYLIDARDLNDAIRIAAKMSGARLGWIEVRPLKECDSG